MVTSRKLEPHNALASNGGGVDIALSSAVGLVSTGKADIADVMDQPSPRVFHHEIDRTNGTIATWLYRVKIGTICMYKGQEFVVMGSTTRFLMLTKAINKSAKDTIAEWIDTIAASQGLPGLKVMTKEQMQPIKDDILIFPPNLIYVSRTLTSEGYDAYFVIDKSAGPMWHKSLWQSIPSYHRGVDYYNHVFSKYGTLGGYDKSYVYRKSVALRGILELS